MSPHSAPPDKARPLVPHGVRGRLSYHSPPYMAMRNRHNYSHTILQKTFGNNSCTLKPLGEPSSGAAAERSVPSNPLSFTDPGLRRRLEQRHPTTFQIPGPAPLDLSR